MRGRWSRTRTRHGGDDGGGFDVAENAWGWRGWDARVEGADRLRGDGADGARGEPWEDVGTEAGGGDGAGRDGRQGRNLRRRGSVVASVVSSKRKEPRERRFARAARLGVEDDARTDARAIRGRRDVDGRARARTRRIRRGRRAPSGDPRGVPRRLKHGAIVPVGAPASRRRGPTRGPPRRGSPPGGGAAPEPRGRSERQTSRAEGRVASPRRPVGYDARAQPRHPDERIFEARWASCAGKILSAPTAPDFSPST